ncbi:sodium:solute symporter family protein [uncultured Imperialibacter sp.]|uniref:sodium:solute symporter family protein n=1 Tax=uncultured Imperialibacter sp. TaxID=1672639 RepID=UPI0030D72ECC|tara:strand:- start:12995 stop:14383 length:1389 start_codon:yes stop_codon:yes gene_type:complete
MNTWLIIFFIIFIGLLVLASVKSYQKNRTSDEFMLAGSAIGAFLGFMTFAAALFSAFTFMGMPDFFRNHGVGAWIFLAFSDALMVFFIIWFGYKLRKLAKAKGFKGIAGLLAKCYESPWAGYLFFLTAFLFLIPYVAIQIRGISIFLNAAFPDAIPSWGWSAGTVVIMLIYAEIGGLKAIVYSDAIQGILLLVVIWIIGLACLEMSGGLGQMMANVGTQNPDLLTLPGPKGLFSTQFLIGSAIAIVMIPVTQPQLTTRLIVMKDLKSVHKMTYAVGLFAILVILPTAFIGLYGALKYPDVSTSEFLSSALLFDQANPVAALAVVGLFAACLSTTNAQIFALGSELRSLLSGEDKTVMRYTKISLLVFSLVVLVFSIYMSDQLVLLARLSFTGTSVMAPLVLAAVIFENPPKVLILTCGLALIGIILNILSVIPAQIAGLNFDIVLYMVHGGISVLIMATHKK